MHRARRAARSVVRRSLAAAAFLGLAGCVSVGAADLPAGIRGPLAALYGPSVPWEAPSAPVDGLPADLDPLSAAALRQLNAWRTATGLPAYRYDASLTAMAMAHVRYAMARSKAGKSWEGHFEAKGDPAYSTAGNEAASTSGIAYGDSDPLSALTGLMEGTFHRLQFLDAGDTRVGVGFGSWPGQGNSIALFVTRPDAGTPPKGPRFALFPGDGSTGIPPGFEAGENPDPRPGYEALPLARRATTGFPVTVMLSYKDARAFQSVDTRLLDPEGNLVPCWVTDPAHPSTRSAPDIYAPGVSADGAFATNFNTVFIMPKSPLARGATYRVEATLRIGAETSALSWSFTTAPVTSWRVSARPSTPLGSAAYALAHALPGDTILFDAGTYTFDRGIDLSGVRLRGAGADATTLRFPDLPDDTPVGIRGAVALENLTLESPSQLVYVRSGGTLLLQDAALRGGNGSDVAFGLERGSTLVLDGLSATGYRTSYLCYALADGAGSAPSIYRRAVTGSAKLVYGTAIEQPLDGRLVFP